MPTTSQLMRELDGTNKKMEEYEKTMTKVMDKSAK